jgi:hypothetical protein
MRSGRLACRIRGRVQDATPDATGKCVLPVFGNGDGDLKAGAATVGPDRRTSNPVMLVVVHLLLGRQAAKARAFWAPCAYQFGDALQCLGFRPAPRSEPTSRPGLATLLGPADCASTWPSVRTRQRASEIPLRGPWDAPSTMGQQRKIRRSGSRTGQNWDTLRRKLRGLAILMNGTPADGPSGADDFVPLSHALGIGTVGQALVERVISVFTTTSI